MYIKRENLLEEHCNFEKAKCLNFLPIAFSFLQRFNELDWFSFMHRFSAYNMLFLAHKKSCDSHLRIKK